MVVSPFPVTASELLQLDYSLDGEPFVQIAARANIDTLGLDYSLDGEPFIGVSA